MFIATKGLQYVKRGAGYTAVSRANWQVCGSSWKSLFNTFDGQLIMALHYPNSDTERSHFFEVEVRVVKELDTTK